MTGGGKAPVPPDVEDIDSPDVNLRELSSLLTNNADPVNLGFAGDISYEEIVGVGLQCIYMLQ